LRSGKLGIALTPDKPPLTLSYARPREGHPPKASIVLFLITGAFVVLGIPTIFYFNQRGWNASLLVLAHLAACLLCFGSAARYIHRSFSWPPRRFETLFGVLAVIGMIVSALWIVFVVIATWFLSVVYST
jgi:hypothetical protein